MSYFLSDPVEIAEQEAREFGCKLFVGNIRFDDLRRRFVTVPPFKKHARERIHSLLSFFSRYGHVSAVRASWQRSGIPMDERRAWCFVVYQSPAEASAALDALREHAHRVQLCRETVKQRRATNGCVYSSPRADFYVRRPRNYSKAMAAAAQDRQPQQQHEHEQQQQQQQPAPNEEIDWQPAQRTAKAVGSFRPAAFIHPLPSASALLASVEHTTVRSDATAAATAEEEGGAEPALPATTGRSAEKKPGRRSRRRSRRQQQRRCPARAARAPQSGC